ncbi:MAG: DUF1232 domain-containing protein [Chloroflexi bacterium]|nr:DUF1232 domain-containing protein [Chloroflexota bacterium]
MAGRRIDPTRYTDPGLLGRIAEQVRLSFRLMTDQRVPTALKLVIPAMVAIYAVSPVDLIPDVLLGVGQLDDIGVVLAALALFVRLAPRQVVDEHRAAMTGRPAQTTGSAPTDEWWRSGGAPAPASGQPIDVEYTMDGRHSGSTH